MPDAASPKGRRLLRILLVRIGTLSACATAEGLPMKSWIKAAAAFLSFASVFMSGDAYARMMGASMGEVGMMEGMMGLMAIFWLLVVAALGLAIAALIKYVFRK